MTLTAEPIAGSTRVVVLSSEPGVARGGAAEFRRFGLSLVLREDILAALTEVVHDGRRCSSSPPTSRARSCEMCSTSPSPPAGPQ